MPSSTDQIKIVTINVEGDNHLARVMQFLEQTRPDVVCFQEVYQVDVELLKNHAGLTHAYFVPTLNVSEAKFNLSAKGIQGIAILCRSPLSQPVFAHHYYAGSAQVKQLHEANDASRAVAWVQLTVHDVTHYIATTHFTWSPDGMTTDLQLEHADKMLKFLQQFPSLVLCGDMNAPRQSHQVWQQLSTRFIDTIPLEVDTTLTELHRLRTKYNKPVPRLVVDGIFITPDYYCLETTLDYQVSDHAAVMGRLIKQQVLST